MLIERDCTVNIGVQVVNMDRHEKMDPSQFLNASLNNRKNLN